MLWWVENFQPVALEGVSLSDLLCSDDAVFGLQAGPFEAEGLVESGIDLQNSGLYALPGMYLPGFGKPSQVFGESVDDKKLSGNGRL